MEDQIAQGLLINRPDWFQDAGFVRYLNSPQAMTWHNGGLSPDEFADVVVLVDPGCSGEGPDADAIPSAIWNEIVSLCRDRLGARCDVPHYAVRITNLDGNAPEGDSPTFWGQDPDYPVSDWQYEVANDDTRLSYWQWVSAQRSEENNHD